MLARVVQGVLESMKSLGEAGRKTERKKERKSQAGSLMGPQIKAVPAADV